MYYKFSFIYIFIITIDLFVDVMVSRVVSIMLYDVY